MPYTASRHVSLVMARPMASASLNIQLAKQLRQKPARSIISTFCTSVRLRRWSTRRRNTAASSSVRVLSSIVIKSSGFVAVSGRLVAKHRLHLEILLEPEHAVLTSVAGLFVAAERNARVGRGTIQVDAAGADLRSNPPRPLDVARLDVTRQSVRRIVGKRDRLFLGLIGEHREHGAENFLTRNRHLGLDVGEDSRARKGPAVEPGGATRPATHQGRAFLNPALDKALHFVELRFADQGTHAGLRIEGIDDPHGTGRPLGSGAPVAARRAQNDHSGRRLT